MVREIIAWITTATLIVLLCFTYGVAVGAMKAEAHAKRSCPLMNYAQPWKGTLT